MPAYTPGPWRVDRLKVRGNQDHIVVANCDYDMMSYEEGGANARLIAAAPELLEALRDCDRMVDRVMARLGGNGTPTKPDASWAREVLRTEQSKARAALAKAEGATP